MSMHATSPACMYLEGYEWVREAQFCLPRLKAPSQWSSSQYYTALWTVAFAVLHLRFLWWDHIDNAPRKCRCLSIHTMIEEQDSLSTASVWALSHSALMQTPFCIHLLACKAWLYTTKTVLVLMQCIFFLLFFFSSICLYRNHTCCDVFSDSLLSPS